MRTDCTTLLVALICGAVAGCGDNAAIEREKAVRIAAEGRAAAAEKALAKQQAAEQKATIERLTAEKKVAEEEAAKAKATAEKTATKREPTQAEIDKQAFLTARKAAEARTWGAANQILKKIDQHKIEDLDVITYVDFSVRCVDLAMRLGIDRNADPNSTGSVMSSLNLTKFASSLIELARKDGLGKAAGVVADAHQIQKEIPVYTELDSKLAAKYGTG